MPGFEDLHLTGAVAEALASMGWSADAGAVREVVPTAARGHNLVAVTPPSPAYAAPALAGVLSRIAATEGGRALVLCPAAELDEWGALAHALARGTSLRVQVAHGTARALRRLRTEQLDLLVAAPETALLLLQRAALKLEAARAILIAWPEQWEEPAALDALLQDLPKDAQRVVFTSDPSRAGDLAERWARRALTVGTLPLPVPGDETPPPPSHPLGPVRTVHVSWQRRAAALGELVELLDPQSLVIWAADRSQESAIARALPLSDPAILVTTGDAPAAQYVVAYDLPSRDRLQQLLSAGEVILLVPPGTEGYLQRIAAPARPLRLPGLLEQVATAAAARRATIQRRLDAGAHDHALAVLAPLFERHDPTAVAAALYDLWLEAAGGQAPSALPDVPATTRIFVGVGKRDGATPADIVAVLTKELKVDRSKIGRIELRDAFSLVELPATDAERIAQAMNGAQIRRKRVTVRVDRGPTGPGPRGPARARQ